MTRVLAGPYCTQILGDLGAEVIKIEHPIRGDDTRAWGPPYASYRKGTDHEGPGESAYFLAVNRNKKSLGLSFQHPEGVELLHKLAAKCDILVENYLPGSLKKYGMDFETIHKINPGLIYASITGYGQTGPYSQRAGYDVMVEAEFGLMHITGNRDGPPVKVGVAVTDLTTGLYTSNSIMAALLSRGKTGRGQHIDVALSDCQTATLANIASSCLISGKRDSGRWGTAHPSIVPYKSFRTKDGDVLFGGGNDRLFGILCDGLGRPEWKTDPLYSTNAHRVANRDELEHEIEKISTQKTTQEWLEVFEGKGMPYAAVNDVQDSLNHEHSKARNMVVEVEHEQCGSIKLVNTPVKYSESTPGVRTAPPTLGQHTDEVLGEILGLDGSEVAALKEKGASYNRYFRPATISIRVGCASDGVIFFYDIIFYNNFCIISQGRKPRFDANMEEGLTESKPDAGDAPSAPAPAAQPPAAGPSAPSPAPSNASSTSRPHYIPQFSAATQMILKRINSKPGSLSAALSSASSVARTIEKSTFEDAKRRLVMNMNTSLTMPMPNTKPASFDPGPSTMPISDAFQLRTPAPSKSLTLSKAAVKVHTQKVRGKTARGTKRKRGKDNEDGTSSLSDVPDSEGEAATASKDRQAVPTMTKSGRQVQKPTQYNPSQKSQKRRNYGKRTAEQALCKVCTRGLSPANNQIVFCDGCNFCWHQLCHDPYIDDEFVSNESRSWFCNRCLAKREKHLAKKKSLEGFKGVSWAAKSAEQRRAYLSSVPHAQLVNIIMYSSELHPDLPIFPAHEPVALAKRGPQGLFAGSTTDGLFPRADASASGPIHFVRKTSTPEHANSGKGNQSGAKAGAANGNGKAGSTIVAASTQAAESEAQDQEQDQAARESSVDSVPPAWPKVGQGCLAGVEINEDDLQDKNDFEAFSVTTYDSKGKKIWENGMPV
ncbi:CoA-transferase family III domain-containing protein [Biscogniauxia marginata]|nr:CoA-transferase family III domain-containing protein [Biscogniauxia marginata]